MSDELRLATIEVLRERGFAGLTLERVAEVSGLARSTLWRQGLTREVLVRALVSELAEDFRSSLYPSSPRAAPAASGSSAGSKRSAISWTATSR